MRSLKIYSRRGIHNSLSPTFFPLAVRKTAIFATARITRLLNTQQPFSQKMLDFSTRLHSDDIKGCVSRICAPGGEAVLDDVFRIAVSPAESKEANNAVWVLTHLPRHLASYLAERRDALADRLLSASDDTRRRLLATLLSNMTWTEDDFRGDVFDFCLENMASRSVPLGIRARCIYLAHRMSAPVPELGRELALALDILSAADLPPALRSAVRHVSLRRSGNG